MIKDVLKYLQPNAVIPIDMETTIMLVNALKEALAQPEQEPVQYKCTVIDDQHPNGIPLEQWVKPPQPEQEPRIGCVNHDCDQCKAQRTEPAQQKKVWTFWDLSGGDIADAIKAKLKEKNT